MSDIQSPRALNFKDFLVYRYADPEKARRNSLNGAMARLAMQVLRDPSFPDASNLGQVVDFIETTPEYEWCTKKHLPAEAAWIDYTVWLLTLSRA